MKINTPRIIAKQFEKFMGVQSNHCQSEEGRLTKLFTSGRSKLD